MVRKWNENKKETSAKFKELQKDFKMKKMLEQRQKSSDERELERLVAKDRENMIHKELQRRRKKETKDSWKSNNFGGKVTITKTDSPILKAKNIFIDNKNKIPITNKGGMFFR